MSSSDLTTDDGYQGLLGKISEVYASGKVRATQAVNAHITATYWQIGRDIVEFEQGGQVRAEYGKALLTNLSRIFPYATVRASAAAICPDSASSTPPTQFVRRLRTN